MQLVREQMVDKDEATVAKTSQRQAMDTEELWTKIDSMNKEQVIELLEAKDDEVERLRAYVDHLSATVIEKAPNLLGEINSPSAKVCRAPRL